MADNLSTNELLQFALQNGMLDLAYVQEQIDMQKRQEILEKHPYEVWKGKNGNWYTYLPDDIKGRTLKKRTTEKGIEDAIVDYYKKLEEEQESTNYDKKTTISELFPKWIKYKSTHTTSNSYIRRIYTDWNKFYKDDKIINKPIKYITELELDEWAHEKISEYILTKTAYYNMTVIIRQVLEYAVGLKIIKENPFTVKIDTKMFLKKKKKEDYTQVFLLEEQPLVERECWRTHETYPQYTTPLAILLSFRTGLRVGELVALNENDIEGDYIHVQRAEVTDYYLNEKSEPVYNGTKIVEHTKSDAGDRYVYLTEEAKYIINQIMKVNRIYHNTYKGYLFVYNNKIINSHSILGRLYIYCDRAGIDKKSTHKIRKTVISGLIDNGVNINTIRKMVGHEKEETTYKNYCFDRRQKNVIESQIEDALNTNMVIKSNHEINIDKVS